MYLPPRNQLEGGDRICLVCLSPRALDVVLQVLSIFAGLWDKVSTQRFRGASNEYEDIKGWDNRIFLRLKLWFSARRDFASPRGLFGCHNLCYGGGRELLLTSLKHPPMHRMLPQQTYLAPNARSAAGEKPWVRVKLDFQSSVEGKLRVAEAWK